MARFIVVHDRDAYPNSAVYVNLDRVEEIRPGVGGCANIYFSSLTPEGERTCIRTEEELWKLNKLLDAAEC